MNALVVIETLSPAVYSEAGGIEALLQKLEADVRAVPTDISTAAGRAAVKSLAYKVARSKTALDDMGKSLVADLKKQTGAVDAERRAVRERLDALADEVRKPLTDWENADKDRIAAHQGALQAIIDLTFFAVDRPVSSEIADRLSQLDAMPACDWQEFAAKARDARAETFAILTTMKDSAAAHEAEQAELARHRAEAAERDQRERDERIAREAAERATREAEAKAAREAKLAADKAAAEQMRVEREAAEAIERAERAEQDRIAAEQKAARDAQAAVDVERRRVADARAAEDAAEVARAADERNRAKVNSAVHGALIEVAAIADHHAAAIVQAIAAGKIPHVKISY